MVALEHIRNRNQNDIILEAMLDDYQSCFIIDLDERNVYTLKTDCESVKNANCLTWDEHVIYFISRIYEEDRSVLQKLTFEKLKEYYFEKTSLFPFEIRCLSNEKLYDWMKVEAKIMRDRQLLITIKNTNENHLMKDILTLYIE